MRALVTRTYPTEGFIAEDVQRPRPDIGESKRLTHRRVERLKRSVPIPRYIDLPSSAAIFFLLLRTGTGAHTPPAVGAGNLLPRSSIRHHHYRPAFAWPTSSRQVANTSQFQYDDHVCRQFVSQPKPQPPRIRPRKGILQAKGVNGREISDTTAKDAPNSRQKTLLHQEAAPIVERPRVKAPVDLPQVSKHLPQQRTDGAQSLRAVTSLKHSQESCRSSFVNSRHSTGYISLCTLHGSHSTVHGDCYCCR